MQILILLALSDPEVKYNPEGLFEFLKKSLGGKEFMYSRKEFNQVIIDLLSAGAVNMIRGDISLGPKGVAILRQNKTIRFVLRFTGPFLDEHSVVEQMKKFTEGEEDSAA